MVLGHTIQAQTISFCEIRIILCFFLSGFNLVLNCKAKPCDSFYTSSISNVLLWGKGHIHRLYYNTMTIAL